MTVLSAANLFEAMAVRRSFDYANPRAPADALPIVIGDCTGPASAGGGLIRAAQIDTVNDVWAVAGHEVLSVAAGNSVSVYDDGGLVAPGEYTFNPANNYEGQGIIATLDFSVAPTGEPRVRMKGLNAGSSLVENPVTVIESVLTSLYSFPASVFDSSSLEAARAFCDGEGYKAAGVVEDDTTYAGWMSAVLREFLGSFWTDGRKRARFFFQDGSAPQLSRIGAFLSEIDSAGARMSSSRRDIINRVPASYAYNPYRQQYEMTEDGNDTKDAASITLHGERLPGDGRLRLRWIRHTATVTSIQNKVVARFSDGVRLLNVQDTGAAGLELERGDLAVLSVSWLYDRDLRPLRNQIWRVSSKVVNMREQAISLALEDTGYYFGSDGLPTSTGARLTEALR